MQRNIQKNLTKDQKDDIIDNEPCEFCEEPCGNEWCSAKEKDGSKKRNRTGSNREGSDQPQDVDGRTAVDTEKRK